MVHAGSALTVGFLLGRGFSQLRGSGVGGGGARVSTVQATQQLRLFG